MNKFLKKGLIFLVIVFIGMQFYTPEKNISETYSTAFFENETQPPAPILATLQNKCYDCHSNNTNYPWYNNIAPVSYWIDDHILDGKKHLNFSGWTTYSTKKKDHKIEELVAEVQEGEMPLKEYTWTHGGLTEDEVKGLIAWAERNRVIYQYALKYKNGQLAQ
tara:strand:+ start:405 stop:893 length:489 start_codon:yes stop_codon:yes gene_type:complete